MVLFSFVDFTGEEVAMVALDAAINFAARLGTVLLLLSAFFVLLEAL